jgi:hypothetical protein
MAMKRFGILGLAALASACAPAAPAELAGLWAMGPGGCAAPAGLTFEADAIRIANGPDRRVLFADPRYSVRPDGDGLAVTIRYTARRGLFGPQQTGELALYRDSEGWLSLRAHRTSDGRRGFARMRLLEADPMAGLLRTRQCDSAGSIGGLRGRPVDRVAEHKGAAGPEPGGAVAGTGGGGVSPPPAVGTQLRGRAAVLQDAS